MTKRRRGSKKQKKKLVREKMHGSERKRIKRSKEK